jgi:hypothetical protein
MNALNASLLGTISFSTMHYNTKADAQQRMTALNHDINVVYTDY